MVRECEFSNARIEFVEHIGFRFVDARGKEHFFVWIVVFAYLCARLLQEGCPKFIVLLVQVDLAMAFELRSDIYRFMLEKSLSEIVNHVQ